MKINKIVLDAPLKAREEQVFDLGNFLPLGRVHADQIDEVAYRHFDTWIRLENGDDFCDITARYVKFTARTDTQVRVELGHGYIAERDEAWRAPFNRRSGWTGGDGIFSFNLKSGNDNYDQRDARTFFCFGDTLIGKSDPATKKRTDPLLMPNNTIAYLDGNGTAHKDIDFRINTDKSNSIISYIDPANPSMYDGTVPEHLINYSHQDNTKAYLSGYNPKKVHLLFDLSINQHVNAIDLYNYFSEKDKDSDVNKRGIKQFSLSISLDKVKWLNLGDFTLEKAKSIEDYQRFEIHKPCRYIKLTVPPKQGIGNHYDPNDAAETIFGLNKVYIHNYKRIITDIDVQATSILSKKPLDSWFWLQDGVVIGNSIYFLPLLVIPDNNKPEGLKFAVQGVSLVKAPIEDGEVRFDRHTQKNTPLYRYADGKEWLFGAAILPNFKAANPVNADGYVYVYGYTNAQGGCELRVARVKPDNFEHIDHYEYYTDKGWEKDMIKAKPLLKHISCEMSVTPIIKGVNKGKYVAVFQYDVNSNYVAYSIGETPWGPFTEPRIVHECEEHTTLKRTAYTYNAKAHPHLSTPESLLVSYNVNSYDMQHHLDDVEVYHPRFLRLRDTSLNDL